MKKGQIKLKDEKESLLESIKELTELSEILADKFDNVNVLSLQNIIDSLFEVNLKINKIVSIVDNSISKILEIYEQ